jgi:AcrR family transcriptional regulator
VGTVERREREKAELRQLIMDTARKLFAERGFDAVSMRAIADAIEYSPTAIYLYFPDKEALFRQLCHADFASLAQAFHRIGQIDDPVERIRQVGRAYVRFGIEHPQHYRLMFMTPAKLELGEDARQAMTDPSRDGYAFLRLCVQGALKHDAFRNEYADVELLCQTLWAAMHGVTALQVTHGNDPCTDWRPIDVRLSTMGDAVLRGLCKPGRFDSRHVVADVPLREEVLS